MFDIENQEKTDSKPGETGGEVMIITASIISIIYGIMLIMNEKDYVWRPHRVIQGIVIIVSVCAFILSPLFGVIEVIITNKGTVYQGMKNSYIGAGKLLCCLLCSC